MSDSLSQASWSHDKDIRIAGEIPFEQLEVVVINVALTEMRTYASLTSMSDEVVSLVAPLPLVVVSWL